MLREQQTIHIGKCGSVAPVTSHIKISAYNKSQTRRFSIYSLWNVFYGLVCHIVTLKSFLIIPLYMLCLSIQIFWGFFPFYFTLLFFNCWVLLIGRDFAVDKRTVITSILYTSKLCEMPLTLFLMDNNQYFCLNCHTLHNCFVQCVKIGSDFCML